MQHSAVAVDRLEHVAAVEELDLVVASESAYAAAAAVNKDLVDVIDSELNPKVVLGMEAAAAHIAEALVVDWAA